MTTTIRDAPIYRLTVEPSQANGLDHTSQIMVDKVMAVRRSKCGPVIGRLQDTAIVTLNRMLPLVVGIVD